MANPRDEKREAEIQKRNAVVGEAMRAEHGVLVSHRIVPEMLRALYYDVNYLMEKLRQAREAAAKERTHV